MAGLALALAVALGQGLNFRRTDPPQPRQIPLVAIGLGLLWFGWFGFNGGSALSAGVLATNAVVNTMVPAAPG